MPRLKPGSLLVVGLLGLGLTAAAVGIWFQWQQTRRCLAFYGVETAERISRAPLVELWLLQPSARDGHTGRLQASRRLDISEAKGLVHLRRGLVEDANFDWKAATSREPRPDAAWDVAFHFTDADATAGGGSLLAVDFGSDPGDAQLAVVGRPGHVSLGKMAKGLRDWVAATTSAAGLTDPSRAASARD